MNHLGQSGLNTRTCISHTHSKSHWATTDTVFELVNELYFDHVAPRFAADGFDPSTTYWMIIWDVHYSHRDKQTIKDLKENFPTLVILFVPAGCTSLLQPLDISFNKAFKAHVKKSAAAWMASQVTFQINRGVPPNKVRIPKTKSAVVPAYCGWLKAAVEYARSPVATELFKTGWRDLDIAWQIQERESLLEEARHLDSTGELWRTNPKEKNSLPYVPQQEEVAESSDSEDEPDYFEDGDISGREDEDEEEKRTHVDSQWLSA